MGVLQFSGWKRLGAKVYKKNTVKPINGQSGKKLVSLWIWPGNAILFPLKIKELFVLSWHLNCLLNITCRNFLNINYKSVDQHILLQNHVWIRFRKYTFQWRFMLILSIPLTKLFVFCSFLCKRWGFDEIPFPVLESLKDLEQAHYSDHYIVNQSFIYFSFLSLSL
jgi:hypothetical protein